MAIPEKDAFRGATLTGAVHQSLTFPGLEHIAADKIEAVSRAGMSGHVNYWMGTQTRGFEGEYAPATASQYGIAVASGAVSGEPASLVLGAGDDVITTTQVFLGPVNGIALKKIMRSWMWRRCAAAGAGIA